MCILKKLALHVNAVDKNGRTALHFACAAGKPKNVRAIFQVPKVMKDPRTNGGLSPIMYAVQACDIHTMAECLNAGSNPFLEDGFR